MRRLFEDENRVAFFAISVLLTAAFATSSVAGTVVNKYPTITADPVLLAHGPSIPPDPWEGVRLAHGPQKAHMITI
jgi:hypothetical protein